MKEKEKETETRAVQHTEPWKIGPAAPPVSGQVKCWKAQHPTLSPPNSYLPLIHTRHAEKQLLDVQIYSETVSIHTLHLKVFTVPRWCWKAFRHGLSTSSSKFSPCHTSPLRYRRAASASLRRGWKAFLAAVCVWGTSCHSQGLICQWRVILKRNKANKNIIFGGPSFIYSIYYLCGCMLP